MIDRMCVVRTNYKLIKYKLSSYGVNDLSVFYVVCY